MSRKPMEMSFELRKWLKERKISVSLIKGEVISPGTQRKLRSELTLDPNCQTLFQQLLNDCNGISTEKLKVLSNELGWTKDDVDDALDKLFNSELARSDPEGNTVLLKALPIAFDSRVQYLIGYAKAF